MVFHCPQNKISHNKLWYTCKHNLLFIICDKWPGSCVRCGSVIRKILCSASPERTQIHLIKGY